jgi:hypothetical protein
MSDEKSNGKAEAEKVIIQAGAGIGGAAGGAVAGAAVTSVAATAAANTAAAAAASAALAAGGPFAAFEAAMVGVTSNPATWAVLASNPIGQAILIGGGAAFGAVACYKLAKKFL